ncbi:UNVERIFIED_CONTAM: hypothetical protein Sindi_0121700 [Sesamum indicum]
MSIFPTLPERLQLHGSDHPGMTLVSAPLTGNNYLNWSFGVKRAFRAKMKLCFIGGTSTKPNADDLLLPSLKLVYKPLWHISFVDIGGAFVALSDLCNCEVVVAFGLSRPWVFRLLSLHSVLCPLILLFYNFRV